MPVKIRLARHGRKRKPFYHIVIADSRSPRDGRLIERIGSFNPNTNPATIELDFDKALDWLQKGAQPTDTMRTILSTKGVLHMNHLLKGVKKGAFSEEVAKERFADWIADKEARLNSEKEDIDNAVEKDKKNRLSAESKVNQARAEAIAAAQSELVAEAEKAAEEEIAANAEEEVTEEPAAEAAVEEVKEEPAKVEEKKEEPVKAEEKKEEAPEAKAENTEKSE